MLPSGAAQEEAGLQNCRLPSPNEMGLLLLGCVSDGAWPGMLGAACGETVFLWSKDSRGSDYYF